MSQSNPKTTQIALNGDGGAYKDIFPTIMAGKIEVIENPGLNAGVAQGLQGYYLDPDSNPAAPVPDPNIPGQQVWLPNTAGQVGRAFQPIIFGGSDGRVHGGEGRYAGAVNTPLLRLRSNSATATGILLVEWP